MNTWQNSKITPLLLGVKDYGLTESGRASPHPYKPVNSSKPITAKIRYKIDVNLLNLVYQ
jgi:hypothetical protein